jgi:hypothetical protein
MGLVPSGWSGNRRGASMNFELRSFATGLLCGGLLIAAAWAGSVWWKSHGEINDWVDVPPSPEDAALYDACLAGRGNTIACDAWMRVYKRMKAQDDALEKILKEGGARMLTSGASKREVVDWARGMGGVGRQLSDAAGISLKDLQDGKY